MFMAVMLESPEGQSKNNEKYADHIDEVEDSILSELFRGCDVDATCIDVFSLAFLDDWVSMMYGRYQKS